MTEEAEHTAADGTTRLTHYGRDRQPVDDIREHLSSEAAAGFFAGSSLKYLRRDSVMKGTERERDLKHARVYWEWLNRLAAEQGTANTVLHDITHKILTPDEMKILEP